MNYVVSTMEASDKILGFPMILAESRIDVTKVGMYATGKILVTGLVETSNEFCDSPNIQLYLLFPVI